MMRLLSLLLTLLLALVPAARAETMVFSDMEIPADRIGRAEEAGEMIRQVLNAPAYFTGQIVTMDGGWI